MDRGWLGNIQPRICVLCGIVRLRRLGSLGVLAAVLTVPAVGCRLQTEQVPAEVEALAADFTLPAHDGATVALGDLLASGPAIVVFYRGHW